MFRLIFVRLVCLSLLLLSISATAQSQYFRTSVWPDSEESCPLPQDIHNNAGIFTAPASTDGVEWIGAVVDGQNDRVKDFHKGLFVLTKDEYNGLGILSSCMYELSGGQFLAMRLDLGKNYQQGMWIELASQWSKSADGALPTVLECNSKEAAGCAFYLE
ncbi:DUF3757 domain-containing protein [Pseudomonas prosekii]|uniref:DUF3757 domain-containing protein n=1 Tax=Pseudomonas prosekii TaxID=1148509 RepID=UPI00387AEE62